MAAAWDDHDPPPSVRELRQGGTSRTGSWNGAAGPRRALIGVVATACPLSVYTRRGEELAESFGVTQPPKSQGRTPAPCPRADCAALKPAFLPPTAMTSPGPVVYVHTPVAGKGRSGAGARTGLLDPRLCQPMEGTGSRAGSGVTAFGLGAGVTGTGT